MGLFTRKKKTQEPVTEFKLINSTTTPFIPFGDNITKSDVVKVCIDRIASHCSKLKMTYVKKTEDGKQVEIDDFIVSVGEKIGIGDDVSFGIAMKTGISLRSYRK